MPPKKAPVEKGQFFESPDRGISIYYEVNGPVRKEWKEKEETILLLLGSTADLRKRGDQGYVNQTVGYFKVFAYDHRNTGRTTIKDEPCTMEDYADDAAALIQGVMADRVPINVVGTSFGGMVAMHLAIRHPHLIKKLVLGACATGGAGGMSYPIHDWYEPGFDVAKRVEARMFQANTDRNEEWKEKEKTLFQGNVAILSQDENVGKEDPLRQEGIQRQLDARKKHDVYDTIGQLQMPVLVVGSPKDNITPVALMETLAERIGDNCEKKLDFGEGHAFIAADLKATEFINEWIRRPVQIWEIVGGGANGGIIVRAGKETSSAQEADRLSTGALVRELELQGERLHYKRLTGTGPADGWISIKLKDKDLAVKTDKTP